MRRKYRGVLRNPVKDEASAAQRAA